MISVKHNIKALSKSLKGFRDQIPFATSKALNATAFDARKGVIAQLHKDIDRPTPFTISGVRYSNSNKRNLTATIYILPNRWEYLKFQVEGGTRKPRSAKLAIGVGVKRNKYGNPSRGSVKRLLARQDTFSGSVRGVPGIWQRTKKGIKLLYAYKEKANYKAGRFRYYQSVNNTVKKSFNKHFIIAIKQAIKTARL